MIKIRKLAAVTITAFFIGAVFPYLNYALDKTYENLKILIDVMTLIKNNYVEEIDSQKIVYGAAKGMVSVLDDYSQFMEPEVYERIKSDTDGEFGGLGIRIESRDGWLTVITPLPKTPAWKAKMMPGDRIIKIDGESTKDQLLDDSVKKMRGAVGSTVKITISRQSDKKDEWIEKDLSLKRELIVSENVKWHMVDDKVGYIKIVEFTGHVTENFKKAMKEMQSKGMESLILDLRYNPGGLLTGAIDISKLFLSDNKMIVFTKGRKQENYQEFRAGTTATYPDVPLVVLVNRFSASSSEIVAGALQDNKRALIVGERSFGKASVQSMVPLADKSALKLTVAKYYTPSGKSILRDVKNGTGGIVPDISVVQPLEREKQLLLQEQQEEVYYPEEENKSEKDKKADKNLKKEDKKSDKDIKETKNDSKTKVAAKAKDDVIERAAELLRAREILGTLNVKSDSKNTQAADGATKEKK